MKIEILFPEFCNLNGDRGNIKYLEKCLPEAQIIETAIDQEPYFVKNNDINLIYMGTLSEKSQEIVIQKLLPFKQRIQELINNGQAFLLTGNSIEVLGKYIENEDGSRIEALCIFEIYAKRNMLHRHNSFFLGTAGELEVVGFKSQFTMLYGNNENDYWMNTQMGIGINQETKLEGIHKNNFLATYVIGPFLVLNPLMTKKIMSLMGVENPKLAFEKEVMEAYQTRLTKFKKINHENS